MIEVRGIGANDSPLPGIGYVLLERTAGGRWRGLGSDGTTRGRLLSPSPFPNEEEALRSAQAWADAHAVGIIYVRRAG